MHPGRSLCSQAGPIPDAGDLAEAREAGRKEVIRRTAEHLGGVPEESRADFEKTACQVLSDMEEASRLHHEEAQALGLLGPAPRTAYGDDPA